MRARMLILSGAMAAAALPIGAQESGIPDMAALGASAAPRQGRLTVIATFPGSHADELGLKPGDRLTHLERSPVKSPAELAAASRGLSPEFRLSAVVLRGSSVKALSGDTPDLEPEFSRNFSELSAKERIIKEQKLKELFGAAEAAIKSFSRDIEIPAKQTLWMRLPKPLGPDLKPGDEMLAESINAVTADSNLDFLLVPPGSRFWAKVVQSDRSAETKSVRLFFFKMQLKGGNFYPIAGRLIDLSTEQQLIKLTPAGTLVWLSSAEADRGLRLKIELLDKVTITEPSDFFQAGPGLWVKTHDGSYAVTHIAPSRAAAKAGLAEGDILAEINGKPSKQYDFDAVLNMIYGKPGTAAHLGIRHGGKGPIEVMDLPRGVIYKDGKPTLALVPFIQRASEIPTLRAPSMEATQAPKTQPRPAAKPKSKRRKHKAESVKTKEPAAEKVRLLR